MTFAIETTATVNGVEYRLEVATIEATELGENDHGMIDAGLRLRMRSTGIVFGGYRLDHPTDNGPEGTAWGLQYLMEIMKVVGVDRWEKLVGRQVYFMEPADRGWDVGIASLDGTRYFIPKAHLDKWEADHSF
ncbi:hypothetical protein WILDE_82 [Arthrobacter phage Wilde]|uniref:Uncharacterized protein n=1 Tax=Arthrobacter phage Wilde TaxID=1772323 RepID=A0A0U4B7Z2_9CAUD|nr:hypothetical protein WILDE_82 [Arthrobacter phage Wilde]